MENLLFWSIQTQLRPSQSLKAQCIEGMPDSLRRMKIFELILCMPIYIPTRDSRLEFTRLAYLLFSIHYMGVVAALLYGGAIPLVQFLNRFEPRTTN